MSNKFEYLQPADKPVVAGLEAEEVVYAQFQPQYKPLRTLRTPSGRVTSRWTLTPQQRQMIVDGADLFLTLLTFNEPLQPILLAVAAEDVYPEWMRVNLVARQD